MVGWRAWRPAPHPAWGSPSSPSSRGPDGVVLAGDCPKMRGLLGRFARAKTAAKTSHNQLFWGGNEGKHSSSPHRADGGELKHEARSGAPKSQKPRPGRGKIPPGARVSQQHPCRARCRARCQARCQARCRAHGGSLWERCEFISLMPRTALLARAKPRAAGAVGFSLD